MRAAWMLLPLAGCLAGLGWEEVSSVDEGTVCFTEDAGDLEITVYAPACLSSSCSRNVVGTCTATLDGSTVTLTSDISWENRLPGPGVACTDDCGAATASCTLEALPEGDYVVQFGPRTLELAFPAPEPCEPW